MKLKTHRKVFKLTLFLFMAGYSLGILCPKLVSSSDDLEVMLGFALALITGYAFYANLYNIGEKNETN